MESDCICAGKGSPGAACEFPTLARDGDVGELLDKHGYFVVRDLLTQQEVGCPRIKSSVLLTHVSVSCWPMWLVSALFLKARPFTSI